MRFFIEETKEIESITIIDAKSGFDWSADFMEASNFEYDNDNDYYLISKEDFDWWKAYAAEWEEADEMVYELLREKEELGEDYRNYIGGFEFNDLASAMKRFVEEHKS